MPQYILILAASIILGVLGLSRHSDQAKDDRDTMVREIEAAALTVAEKWAGHARDLAFDEADIGAPEVRLQGDASGLSAVLGLDAGESHSAPHSFDDVDDFHGLSRQDSASVLKDVTFVFDITITAGYTQGAGWATSATPTTSKAVTVRVREVVTGNQGRAPVEVVLPVRLTPALQYTHR